MSEAADDSQTVPAGRQRPPVMRRFRKRARQYARHPKFLRWAIRNRWHGLIFDPVGRYRCCGHTTPFHYQACPAASPICPECQGTYVGPPTKCSTCAAARDGES